MASRTTLQTVWVGLAVEGGLWEVSEKCLESLDVVEGTPHLFQRRLITLEDGRQV